jgi:hypothetical protein
MTTRPVKPLGTGDPPGRLGPYRLLGRLGGGATGRVYLGEAPGGGRVAVKTITAADAGQPEFQERFAREIEAARQVARFCTAPVLDADLDADVPWVASEFVDGPSLQEVVAEHGPFPASYLEALAVGVAGALAAIHAAGIVHRDLKPDNVLLSPVGPRVVDFGIAPAVELTIGLTAARPVPSSGAYLAPEQHTGGVAGPPADVFAWGATVAWAGTGRNPYGDGSAASIAYRAVHDRPDLDGLPPALRHLVERAMAIDPAARPTARELLERMTGGVPDEVAGGGRSARRRSRRETRRRVLTIAGAATACVLAVAVGVMAVRGGGAVDEGPPPWSPSPQLAAAGPIVSEDFAVPRAWPEERKDETDGLTERFYDNGTLRVRTTNPEYTQLSPAQVEWDALAERGLDKDDVRQAHVAVDASWHQSGVRGSAVLACKGGGRRVFLRLRADGNWLIVNDEFGGIDSRPLASGRVSGLDPEGLVRIEGACAYTPDLSSMQVTMLVDGEPVSRASIDADGGLLGMEVEAGVVGENSGLTDLSLDNFVLWAAG